MAFGRGRLGRFGPPALPGWLGSFGPPVSLGPLGPPPRRVHPEAMLGPDSVAARVMSDPLTLLGGPRALLLQLAHPLVAAGVGDHSDFRHAPFERLLRTLSALGTVAFDSPEASRRALDALAQTHRTVRGRSPEGRAYSASDPRLATWVHATIVDSYLAIERRWMGRLSYEEREAFYHDTLALGHAFGAKGLPADLVGFRSWMAVRVGELVVSDQAREMAFEVMHPRLGEQWGAIGLGAEHFTWPFMEAVTAELLPPNLRDGYAMPAATGLLGLRTQLPVGLARRAVRRVAPLIRSGEPQPDRPTQVAALLTNYRV